MAWVGLGASLCVSSASADTPMFVELEAKPKPGEPDAHSPNKPAEKTGFVATSAAIGLRLAMTSLRGTDSDGSSFGVQLASAAHRHISAGWFSMDLRSLQAIGGGSAGFEGALAGEAMVGVRVPVEWNHGPFARIGLYGHILGNDKLYSSSFEAPRGQIGYQYGQDGLVVEVGARGGAVVAGRYNAGARGGLHDTGFEVGAYGMILTQYLRLEAGYTHIDERSYDQVDGSVCLHVKLFAACVDGRYMAAPMDFAPPLGTSTATSTYVGLLVGLGI